MRRAAVAAALAVLVAGCGGGGTPSVKIAAASSLTGALGDCAGSISGVRVELEFGGSDDLAAQIRQGVGLDVFAAANMRLPQALAAEGMAGAPVPFATNRLVLAVPRTGAIVQRFSDLAHAPGVKLAVGSAGVPIGAYTRQVLAGLPAAERATIQHEVRTEEPDVKSIVGKLTTGAVDAGFVYYTDTRAAGDRLTSIAIPDRLQPTVVYGLSVVRRSAGASKVVDSILHGTCATALRRAGFGAPPG